MVSTKNRYKVGYTLLITLIFTFVLTFQVFSQKRYKVYEDYISKYSPIAVSNMQKHGIPASIILAQGLLESGAGQSELTKRSNNHFGIKCHRGWIGGRVYAKDDTPNDCFRKYRRAEDSFQDHAQFLVQRSRYSVLFKLSPTDYKGWARGLQQCGYATDKAYANKLIKLIEDYQLYRFDTKRYRKSSRIRAEATQNNWTHQPYKTHGLIYVIAVDGDTYEGIANEFGFRTKDLLKYNEVPKGFPLNAGDLVYFEKKKSRADKPYFEHIVKIGESMHSIAQRYGMRVKNLYKINSKDYEYVPEEGDILKLR